MKWNTLTIFNSNYTCAELFIVSSVLVAFGNISPNSCRVSVCIYILCVIISISPLLSRNFLPSQVSTYVVYKLPTNNMPAKLIASSIFSQEQAYPSVSAVMFCNNFYLILCTLIGLP